MSAYLPGGQYLQVRSHEAHHGMSGAPVLDEKRGVVVGMITKDHTELGRNEETTFAISTAIPSFRALTFSLTTTTSASRTS